MRARRVRTMTHSCRGLMLARFMDMTIGKLCLAAFLASLPAVAAAQPSVNVDVFAPEAGSGLGDPVETAVVEGGLEHPAVIAPARAVIRSPRPQTGHFGPCGQRRLSR